MTKEALVIQVDETMIQALDILYQRAHEENPQVTYNDVVESLIFLGMNPGLVASSLFDHLYTHYNNDIPTEEEE